MDVVHIHTKAIINVDEAKKELAKHLDKMPKRLGCATTIQFIEYFDEILNFLKENGKEVQVGDSNINRGQLLGCNTNTLTNVDDKIDAMFYFGDGVFHPKGLTVTSKKDLYCFDPFTHKFEQFENPDFEKIIRKMKGAALKFFEGKNVGILVTTKPGQQHLARAERLAKYCKEQGKEPYILMADTIDFNLLQDFNFMDVFVNTMCARIGYDDSIKVFRPIINFDDLMEFLDDFQDRQAYNLVQLRLK